MGFPLKDQGCGWIGQIKERSDATLNVPKTKTTKQELQSFGFVNGGSFILWKTVKDILPPKGNEILASYYPPSRQLADYQGKRIKN